MTCKKCKGKVIVDSVYAGEREVEVFCIICGHRKAVSLDKNAFGRWLNKRILKG